MLTEQTILASVSANLVGDTLEVKWLNQILRDGDVVQSVPHRRAFRREEKADFLGQVENGESYTDLLGW